LNLPSQDAPLGPDQDATTAAEDRVGSLTNLVHYGLNESAARHFTQITNRDPELVPGRVVRVDGISTTVRTDSVDYRAVSTAATFAEPAEADPNNEPRSELEIEPGSGPAQPTVGDWVLVRPGDDNRPDRIELVLPRTSLLVRKRVMRGKEQGDEQLLAANVNTVFVVQSATYFNPGRLERELALVWGSGSVPVVILTKVDLLQDADDNGTATRTGVVRRAESFAPGVDVFAVSGITGEGTDQLGGFTATGKTVVLIGASGVGKSTLVNLLMGEEVMDTGEIREADDRGRHTTSTRQLLPLPGGGVLIDSPGIRTIGLIAGSEEAIGRAFSEIEEYLGKCKFRNCSHGDEPGCAINEAIADGRLLQSRFDSYRRMQREIQHEETKNKPAAKTDHQARMRNIAKSARQQSRIERDLESD
jgi:ribosome biogenesis GTPase